MKSFVSVFLATAFLFFGISACGNKKNVSEMMMTGEVKVSKIDGDCALWIMTPKTSSFPGFYPVNLDEQFKVDGLKIAFNYSDSRAPLPENCQNLKAVVISEVKILK
jgi:hypothetical protein